MNKFLRTAGVLSILSGLLGMLSYALLLIGSGSILVPMPISPGEIIDLYSRSLVQSSVFANFFSIIFLFPAILGMGFILRKKSYALALHGSIVGVLGFICLLIQNILEIGVINVVTGHEMCATGMSRESFAVILYNIDQFFMFPALILTGTFYLLFGLGFRKFLGLGKWVGRTFLIEVVLLLLTLFFFVVQKEMLASLGVIAQALATGIAYILAGAVLIRTGK